MIYIACPAYLATGGTELLHQLYFEIKKLTPNVKILYFSATKNLSPINQRFNKYDVEFTLTFEDSDRNIVILPEVYAYDIKKFKKIKKCIWWLSVDNYFLKFNPRDLFRSFRNILLNILRYYSKVFTDTNIINLYQSHYAKIFLDKRGVKNSFYLGDYISSTFLKYKEEDLNSKAKQNIVLYNPVKGYKFTSKLIDFNKDISFIPLANLQPEEIVQLCLSAKIYIDFGNHPGKDRFPRESALLGCIVITNLTGSAKFNEDVPIPTELKFSSINSSINDISRKINDIFTNYSDYFYKLKEYRDIIRSEKVKFEYDCLKIWDQILVRYS
jgi:hypothetical protein